MAAAFTMAVVLLPEFPVAVRNSSLHVALETTAAWIALIAALLVFGRLRRSHNLPDLLLAIALALFGLTNMLLSAVASMVDGTPAQAITMWGALSGRTAAAIVFCLAAFVPSRRLRGRWALPTAGLAAPVCVGLIAGVVALLADQLPAGVGVAVDATVASMSPLGAIAVHPVLASAQVVMCATYAIAAYGFLRGDTGSGDPLRPWLAAAAILASVARAHYALLPSLYADVVYSGDVLRVGFYALLLGGVVAELRATWRALPTEAAADERARIARDLHDGLTQELAFIRAQSTWLAKREPDEARVQLLASAADRALDESRHAIDVLAGTAPTKLADAISRAARDVAVRYSQHVVLDVADVSASAPAANEQLVRIVREAVANAARHAQADVVTVRLAVGRNLLLEVADDGVGFDEAQTTRDGRFGLRSMRERADVLGGTMTITSVSGVGTTVRVEVPWSR